MGQLCTCTRSQAVRVNKEKSPAPRARPTQQKTRKNFDEELIKDHRLHLHHPAYRQLIEEENLDNPNYEPGSHRNDSEDIVSMGLSSGLSPIDGITPEDNKHLCHTTRADSGIFSKTSSSSSADDRPPLATTSNGLTPRLTSGGSTLQVASSIELTSTIHDGICHPDRLDFVGPMSSMAPISHDITASTFSMVSAGSLAYDTDMVDRVGRMRQIYEAKIRRVLLQSVDLLAEELSPASLAEYLRRTRPQQAGASDGDLLAELFGGPDGISPDMEVAAGILKDLLWDVVTCRGLENFEDFCSSLMENDQALLACMIDSIDKLLAVVAPDPRFLDPQILSDQIPQAICCECCRNSEEDNRLDSADCFDTSRDFNIEVIGWEGDGANKDKSKSLTHSPLTRRHKGYDSLTHSMSHSGSNLALITASSLPQLSVRLYRYCLCAGQKLERLEGVLREKGGGCVRELSLVDCHLACTVSSSDEKSWLTTALTNNQSLVKLDLRLSSLGDAGWQGLGEGLGSNSVLRLLNLASSGLGDTSCLQLLSSLSRHTSLSDLDLGFNDIRDAGCKVIAGSSLVRRGGTLRRLRLRDNGITAEGSAALAAALIGNSRLALLDISSNSVGNDGTARLADALISNRSLRDLDLENCGVGEGGCVTLARALRANAALRRLQLSLNPLEDLGAKALAGGLRYNRGLESLSLNMCAISNAGFDSLLEALYASNGTIRLVKLCYNDIGGVKGGGTLEGQWESRQPPLDVLYRKLRELLHRNEDMKMILWGNDLEDLPAFTAYMTPVDQGVAGLSDAVSLTFSDNTTSAEASPAVSGPRGGHVWRRGGPLVPCRS